MFRYLSLLTCLCTTLLLHAQRPEQPKTVFVYINDSAYAMQERTSQSILKKPLSIQGIDVGTKVQRYFYGKTSDQRVGRKPRFAIYPTTQNLNDYAIIRLKQKRDARVMSAPEPLDCKPLRIELGLFELSNLPGMGFAASPVEELKPGEYILLDLTQERVGKLADVRAYPFTVE